MSAQKIPDPTDAELEAEGITDPAARAKWREIHSDLLARYAPVGAAEANLVRQMTTALACGEKHFQRHLAALERLQKKRHEQEEAERRRRDPYGIADL